MNAGEKEMDNFCLCMRYGDSTTYKVLSIRGLVCVYLFPQAKKYRRVVKRKQVVW